MTIAHLEATEEGADMLTIKTISPSGFEALKEVKSVFYSPGMVLPPPSTYEEPAMVTYWRPGDETGETIYEGLVYVMNDNGKTVAKYNLGGFDPQPRMPMTISFTEFDSWLRKLEKDHTRYDHLWWCPKCRAFHPGNSRELPRCPNSKSEVKAEDLRENPG
jgi:hypothetical protein